MIPWFRQRTKRGGRKEDMRVTSYVLKKPLFYMPFIRFSLPIHDHLSYLRRLSLNILLLSSIASWDYFQSYNEAGSSCALLGLTTKERKAAVLNGPRSCFSHGPVRLDAEACPHQSLRFFTLWLITIETPWKGNTLMNGGSKWDLVSIEPQCGFDEFAADRASWFCQFP